MASEAAIKRRQSAGLGRSGPRSKNGCQACKLRRVRCDESKPVCGHCDRLKLECVYRPPQRRSRRGTTTTTTTTTMDDRSQSVESGTHGMDTINAATDNWSPGEDAGFAGVGDVGAAAAAAASAAASLQAMNSSSDMPAPAVCSLTPVSAGGGGDNGILGSMSSSHDADQQQQQQQQPHPSHVQGGLVDTLPWHDQMAFSDYIPVPDPIFSFPSLAFTNSANLLNFDYDPDTHALTMGHPTPAPAQMPTWQFATTMPAVQELPLLGIHDDNQAAPPRPIATVVESVASDAGAASSLSPPFTYCPPLLSPERRQELLSYFDRDIRPPAALVGVDPLGWPRIKRFLLKEARGSTEYVNLALCALTTIMMAPTTSVRGRMTGHNEALLAARLHEAARTAMEIELAQPDWASKRSNALLVSVFLMAWFEVRSCSRPGSSTSFCTANLSQTGFDDRDQIRPHFPSDLAEQVIVKGTGWCAGSLHLLQWLNLLDAKMSHLGGHVRPIQTSLSSLFTDP